MHPLHDASEPPPPPLLSPPASISPTTYARSLAAMADCYAPEMDDLHRRWLPREIFADIGIADVAPGSAAAAAEDFAVHLTAGIFGSEAAAAAVRPPPPPPPPPTRTPPPAPYHQQHQAAQVCGFEGSVLAAYVGCGNGGGAPAAWPLSPYLPFQWQVATNYANGGGVQGGPLMTAPLGPYYGPPPAKRRVGGTGVFLPRTEAYQYQHKVAAAVTKPPTKDAKAPKERSEKKKHQQQQRGDGAQKDQQWQKAAPAAEKKKTTTQQQESASAALLALPQEWTY